MITTKKNAQKKMKRLTINGPKITKLKKAKKSKTKATGIGATCYVLNQYKG
jgi:hypothetical protein